MTLAFDLVIVGGGIHGVGVAQRAAAAFAEQMRALRVGADEAIAMIQAALSAPAPNAPGSTPTPTKA